jgi:hypothetical protein
MYNVYTVAVLLRFGLLRYRERTRKPELKTLISVNFEHTLQITPHPH